MEFGYGNQIEAAFWAIVLILFIVGAHKFLSTAIRNGIRDGRGSDQPTQKENENA